MNREGLHHRNLFLILIFFNIPIMMAIGTISPCCNQLVINGTLNMDPWYQNMMGIFTLFEELPWVSYEKRGDISGKFPVYVHYFEDFVSHPQRRPPPRAFLYFYVNEMENYPEMECVERGCWIISRNCININQLNKNNIIFEGMYDATPGNYWFGKKWYHIKTKPTPKCPEHLTTEGARFVNQEGDIDPGLTITCLTQTSGI